jgi:hypothetical protein
VGTAQSNIATMREMVYQHLSKGSEKKPKNIYGMSIISLKINAFAAKEYLCMTGTGLYLCVI